MHFKSPLINPQNMKPRKGPHARERYIPLPILKCAREVHCGGIKAHSLALVNRDSPCEAKWYLRDGRQDLPAVVDSPLGRQCGDMLSPSDFNDGESAVLVKTDDCPKRAIHVTIVKIVFGKHHRGALLEYQFLWRKTPLDELLDTR